MSDVVQAPAEGEPTKLPAEAPVAPAPTEAPPADATPQEGTQPEANPAGEPVPAPQATQEPAPTGNTPQVKPRKAGPIADLLAKKHEADTRAQAAEAKAAELESKLAEISNAPSSPHADATVQQLAEKYDLQPEVLTDIINAARAGMNVELPQEVQDIIAERNLAQAQEAETKAFDNRIDRLANLFPNEPIKAQREKLMALAYSEQVAPDGERYVDKELTEIYFGYIKPEVEPGKASGEANATSGTRASQGKDDPANAWEMSDEEFKRRQDEVRAAG